MTDFRNPLLLVTDTCEAEPALRRAMELVRASGGKLTLLDVAEPMPDYLRSHLAEARYARLVQAEEQRRNARLEILAKEAAAGGVPVTTKMLTGVIFRTAILELLAGAHDLLIKAVDTREPALRAPQGALDRHLLRKCPRPVWLENPEGPRRLSRILVAVNPDPAAPEDQAQAVELLRTAATIARLNGAELHVLHAWKLPGEWTVSPHAAADPELAPLLGPVINARARYVEDALAAAGIAPGQVRIHLVHQRATRAILDALQATQPDLLVMGTVGRTGVPGFFIGNTAERVLGEATCSILARKPAGFVSPVIPPSNA
ncbi:MAG: universal stress protein [Chromatiales bacterium]|nr:universal stress protein [Chromatiales bacterium]